MKIELARGVATEPVGELRLVPFERIGEVLLDVGADLPQQQRQAGDQGAVIAPGREWSRRASSSAARSTATVA
jgi:hypothetical protein